YVPHNPKNPERHWFRTTQDDQDNVGPYSTYYFRYHLPLESDMKSKNNSKTKALNSSVADLKAPRTLLEKATMGVVTRKAIPCKQDKKTGKKWEDFDKEEQQRKAEEERQRKAIKAQITNQAKKGKDIQEFWKSKKN